MPKAGKGSAERRGAETSGERKEPTVEGCSKLGFSLSSGIFVRSNAWGPWDLARKVLGLCPGCALGWTYLLEGSRGLEMGVQGSAGWLNWPGHWGLWLGEDLGPAFHNRTGKMNLQGPLKVLTWLMTKPVLIATQGLYLSIPWQEHRESPQKTTVLGTGEWKSRRGAEEAGKIYVLARIRGTH